MILIACIIWIIFGILGTLQHKQNLTISVSHQKIISKNMCNYPGFNWMEVITFICIDLLLLIVGIILGILWYVLQLRISKMVLTDRLRVEKASYKMFKRGWCI